MEQLCGGYTLNIPAGAFPLSTDSMLLADFVRLPAKANVLDLGSGCGTLGLLLMGKDDRCCVTGIELTENGHLAAEDNIRRNGIAHRMSSLCADLRNIAQLFSPGSFDVCLSNPPYFTGGPESATATARRDDCCSTEDLFAAAGWALKYGGDFFLVHKPEKLAQLCASASAAKLEPKRLRLIRHSPGKEVSLILLQCRKGGKPGLVWEELCLFHKDGSPTEAYRKIYHI